MRTPASSISREHADERPLDALVELDELARVAALRRARRRAAASTAARRPVSSTPASPSRSSVPSTWSGDVQLEREVAQREVFERGTSPRPDRAGTPSPRCRARAIAARGRRPCIELLGAVHDERRELAGRRARRAPSRTVAVGEQVGVDVRDVVAGRRSRARRARLRPAAPAQRGSSATRSPARRRRAARLGGLRVARDDARRPRASSASGASATSPTASRMRGSSVRNSSWLNSTRTCSRSNAPWREVVGLDADESTSRSRRDISRFLNTRSWASPRFVRLLGRQLVEVLEDAFEVAVGGDRAWPRSSRRCRDAGQVVARVAAQRRVVGVLRGRDAGQRSAMPASS